MKKRLSTFTLLDINSEPYERQGELIRVMTHGFETACGGWALYRTTLAEKPAKFAVIRWKGKRKLAMVEFSRIVKGLEGLRE